MKDSFSLIVDEERVDCAPLVLSEEILYLV